MSRVYFHMLDGTVEVHGSERAHGRQLAEALGGSLMSRYTRELGLSEMYARPGMLSIHFGGRDTFDFGGRPWNGWHLILNTSIALGSDALRFLTRMHAQCEIHGWIAGEHRAWLADLVQQMIDDKIVRPEVPSTYRPEVPFSTGWRALVAALRRTAEHPVVMSYSVCEQFPRSSLWHEPPIAEENDIAEAFDDLSEAEQWTACMPSIAHVQITPENLRTQGFGDGLSALDFMEAVHEQHRKAERK